METNGSLWTVTFWKDAAERAIKSAAQSVALCFGGGAINILELDAKVILGAAATGAALSLLTSIGSDFLPFGSKGTASLSKAVVPATGGIDETPHGTEL